MTDSQPTQWFNTTELSLLFSVVFYCNSIVMIFDPVLPQPLALLIATQSSCCIFLLARRRFKMSQPFESLYWKFLFLISILLTSGGDISTRDFSKGRASLLLGFTILVFYSVCMKVRSRLWVGSRREQQEKEKAEEGSAPKTEEGSASQTEEGSVSKAEEGSVRTASSAPNAAEAGCAFIGKGIAIMGRCLVPSDEKMVWILVVGGFLLFVSGIFFYYYYLHSTTESEGSKNHLHVE